MKPIYEMTEDEWNLIPNVNRFRNYPALQIEQKFGISSAFTLIYASDKDYYINALKEHIKDNGKIKESIWNSLKQDYKFQLISVSPIV